MPSKVLLSREYRLMSSLLRHLRVGVLFMLSAMASYLTVHLTEEGIVSPPAIHEAPNREPGHENSSTAAPNSPTALASDQGHCGIVIDDPVRHDKSEAAQ